MSVSEILAKAEAVAATNPKEAEALYLRVLSASSSSSSSEPPRDDEQAQVLRDQEIALVKLGELYRDYK